MTRLRIRFFITLILFVGWIAWLGYASLAKNRGPVISHSLAAQASTIVIAELTESPSGGPNTRVKVSRSLTAKGPAPGSTLLIDNLRDPDVEGFKAPGEYLLFLIPIPGSDEYQLAGDHFNSDELTSVGRPRIYAWSESVEQQAKRLIR